MRHPSNILLGFLLKRALNSYALKLKILVKSSNIAIALDPRRHT